MQRQRPQQQRKRRKVFKTIAAGLGLGALGYFVYQAMRGGEVTTASGDGGFFNDLAGVFMNTGYQALGLVSSGKHQISLVGLSHIKGWEKFSPTVYLDAAGKPTIGYGHLIKTYESFGTISEAQASAILAKDVASAEAAVNNGVKVSISQNQFDALVSFAYNVGNSAFLSSTLLALVNQGRFVEAVQQFGRWIYITVGGQKTVSAGLVNRRNGDARLFQGLA